MPQKGQVMYIRHNVAPTVACTLAVVHTTLAVVHPTCCSPYLLYLPPAIGRPFALLAHALALHVAKVRLQKVSKVGLGQVPT